MFHKHLDSPASSDRIEEEKLFGGAGMALATFHKLFKKAAEQAPRPSPCS